MLPFLLVLSPLSCFVFVISMYNGIVCCRDCVVFVINFHLSRPSPPAFFFSSLLKRTMALHLQSIHHTAIIASNYEVSKHFYVEVLGLKVLAENYREERKSWKCDLVLPSGSQIELFTFPGAPPRPSYPEAIGLRHLAFAVADVTAAKTYLESKGIKVEDVRVDPYTHKRFVFFADPDDLPLELYEN